MAPGRDAERVRELLRTALRAELEPAGWKMLDVDGGHFRLAAFHHAIEGPFAAASAVGLASGIPDRAPVLVTRVSAGVSYEPLRRVSPLLDLFEVSVFSDEIWPAVQRPRGKTGPRLEISTASEITDAADQIAALITQQAIPFAEQHASLDRLLATFSDKDTEFGRLTYAALQATSGRLDDAKQTVAVLSRCEPSLINRRTRRAAWQLTRWIDSGRDPSLIPASPPPGRHAIQPNRTFADRRTQSRAERAALDEVRVSAKGKPRAQARQMLDEALRRHGAAPPSPLWIEGSLDHLCDSREDRIVNGVKGLVKLAGLGVKAAKAIRNREFPDLVPPGWMEPPDNALYAIPDSQSWVAVELAPAARPYLSRVYDEVSHPFGLVLLTAWIRPAPDSQLGDQIEVLLGQEPIGTIPSDDVPAYAHLLKDAAAQDEHPCLQAHLAPRHKSYVLEIAKPPDGA